MIEVNPNTPTSNPASTADKAGSGPVDTSAHKRNLRAAQQALVAEFHTLVGDTEKLLKHTGEATGSTVEELRGKINENLARARELLKETEGGLREQCDAAIHKTEEYVHAKPLQAVGIAAGVGFLLGMLVARR
jgi:ElaB/YqjD/DUF883 family membrane-anchored ribosome-binding protein